MNTAPQRSSLGKYRLIATIGHGGMAHVHLALMAGPAGFNKLLVIKSLREDIAENGEEFVPMFLDEARLAARLNHPNIVQTYEVGEAGGRYFIAMEYLEGQSYKTVLRRANAPGMPLPMQLRVLSEVAKGLHHAHELRGFDGEPLNVVHRDISPHNVFLTYDGQVKLLDFGIAKASNAIHQTRVGVIKGKADYIAPEQIRGENVDRRADVFSLGVMLWEAITGMRFAGGREVAEITKMHNRLTGGERKLLSIRADFPPALVRICERALSLNPEARHPTALAFAQDLDAYLASGYLYPNAQQLADFMAPLFAEEREQLRRLIDQQVKQALAETAALEVTPSQLPTLARQNFSSGIWHMPTPHGVAQAWGHGQPPLASGHTPTAIRTTGLTSGNTPISAFTPATPVSFPTLTGQLQSPLLGAAVPPQGVSLAAPEKSRKVSWRLVAGLLLAAVGGGTYAAAKHSEQAAQVNEPAVPTTVTEVAPAPEPTPAPEQARETVRVTIRVEPQRATMWLDGQRVKSLPYTAEVKRSDAPHKLEVYSQGHHSHRETLVFDRDLDLLVRLEPRNVRRKRDAETAEVPAIVPSEPVTHEKPAVNAPRLSALEPGAELRAMATSRPAISKDVELEEDPYR